MAKQSIQTRARNQANEKAKADKSKRVAKAKKEAVGKIMEATKGETSKALTIASKVKLSTVKDNGVYIATEDQRALVADLVNADTAGINKALTKFGDDLEHMSFRLSCFCVAMAARLQRDKGAAIDLVFGEGGFIAQLERLGENLSIVRINAIKAWLEKYAPVSLDEKTKSFLFDPAKHRKFSGKFANKFDDYVEERLNEPFFEFEREKAYSTYKFEDKLSSLVTGLLNIRKLGEDKKKAKFGPELENLDLDHSELFLKHYANFRRDLAVMKSGEVPQADDSSTEEKPTEESEVAQAA